MYDDDQKHHVHDATVNENSQLNVGSSLQATPQDIRVRGDEGTPSDISSLVESGRCVCMFMCVCVYEWMSYNISSVVESGRCVCVCEYE